METTRYGVHQEKNGFKFRDRWEAKKNYILQNIVTVEEAKKEDLVKTQCWFLFLFLLSLSFIVPMY